MSEVSFKIGKFETSVLALKIIDTFGTLFNDNTFRISIYLRLGTEMCHQYNLLFGGLADKYGLSCEKKCCKI